MKDLRKIENWDIVSAKEYRMSLRQIFQPFDRHDNRWCGYRWYFVIQSFNNSTWFLGVELGDVEYGTLQPGENITLLWEEFHSSTNSQNQKAAMRKAYNIAKAMELT